MLHKGFISVVTPRLEIASELANFNIPNVIVMGEPVPDLVAQAFLKYFLEAFSRPEPLYLAVREAQIKWEDWQGEFPSGG